MAPFGTGAIDVIRAGYEVIPLSFVIDWFIDIGTWLDGLRDTELVVNKSYATRVIDRQVKFWWSDDNPTYTMIDGPTHSDPFRVKAHTITREIDVSPPSLPVFSGWTLSIVRSIDAISLLQKLILSLLGRK